MTTRTHMINTMSRVRASKTSVSMMQLPTFVYLMRFRDDIHGVVGHGRTARIERTSLRLVVHPLHVLVDRVQLLMIGGFAHRRAKGTGTGRRRPVAGVRRARRATGRSIVVGGEQLFDGGVDGRLSDFVVSGEQPIVDG